MLPELQELVQSYIPNVHKGAYDSVMRELRHVHYYLNEWEVLGREVIYLEIKNSVWGSFEFVEPNIAFKMWTTIIKNYRRQLRSW